MSNRKELLKMLCSNINTYLRDWSFEFDEANDEVTSRCEAQRNSRQVQGFVG
jgi:hypothetical protein